MLARIEKIVVNVIKLTKSLTLGIKIMITLLEFGRNVLLCCCNVSNFSVGFIISSCLLQIFRQACTREKLERRGGDVRGKLSFCPSVHILSASGQTEKRARKRPGC